MSSEVSLDRFSAAGEYERHRQKALRLLARRFPRFDEDERLELYHAVWTTVLEKRRRGERIENLEAYLMGGIDKLALKRVGRADARRRVTLDPLGDELARMPAGDASPEERVVLMDEVRWAREIVEELDGRERDVVKLRFDLGLSPEEIRARLGLRERQYRRLIERGTRRVMERVAAADGGGRSRRQLSLFTACLSGMASESQLAEARSLLQSDPKARGVLRAMRRSAHRVAATLPLPALVGSSSEPARSIAVLAKQQVADLASGAKHHAVSAYVRVSDPTPLSGARPGALAAAVAGCVAVGSGTYCAVQGVPEPIRPALGIERSSEKADAGKPAAPPVSQPVPTETPPPVQPPPAPAAPVAPPVQAPPPPPRQEFFDQAPSESGAPAAPAQPSKPAPAPPGGSGEFTP